MLPAFLDMSGPWHHGLLASPLEIQLADKESAAAASVVSGLPMAGPLKKHTAEDNPDLRRNWKHRVPPTAPLIARSRPGPSGMKVSAFAVVKSAIWPDGEL